MRKKLKIFAEFGIYERILRISMGDLERHINKQSKKQKRACTKLNLTKYRKIKYRKIK